MQAGSIAGAGLLAGVALGVLGVRAEAQEFCIACAEPPATYRCIIEGARPGGGQPLQALCASAMAKEGRHANCSVKGGTVFDCAGPTKRVSWAAYNAAAPASAAPGPAAAPDAVKKDAAKDTAPATVEEMAKRSGGQAADQAKSVGQKMGEAGKKTWNCIASLFTRCGE